MASRDLYSCSHDQERELKSIEGTHDFSDLKYTTTKGLLMGQIKHWGRRCTYRVDKYEGASVTRTPGQLVGGGKACRNREEQKKKSWLPHHQAVHLLGSRQIGWIRPKWQSPCLSFFPPFCFFLFSLFTIRVVYYSFDSHIWITLTCLSSLDWKQCLVFPKPLGHEMHAGCNPKPQSEPRGWRRRG